MGFLKDLSKKILIGDGAMGTMLYTAGVDSCFEELNLSQPERISEIHRAYVKAGADVIQTNTYGANAIKLDRYGLHDAVKTINKTAVMLAREAASNQTYVFGTLGGIRGINKNVATLPEIKASFLEQCDALLEETVDGLILETYYNFEELKEVLSLARARTDLPIVAQVSLYETERLQDGTYLPDALAVLESLGADVVGLNCRLGPYHMLEAFEQIPLMKHAFLSVYPNASFPGYEEGRYVYNSDASYFEQAALEFRQQGARLIGGCCGTTPWHIEAMADKLRGLTPVIHKELKEKVIPIEVSDHYHRRKPHLHEQVKKGRSLIVELDPPKNLKTTKFMEGARALKKAGIDAITLADNSLASPRISNMAMATLIKEQIHLRPLVHVACRDRNIIGLQSHLLGLHALGLNQLLAITGDPTKVGDFPGATSVFDVSSIELIELIKQMNHGLSFSGQSLQEQTNFSVAAAFNPNVKKLDRAVQRLERKIRMGADYFITQPIYHPQLIEDVYNATKHLETPIYIGIMPLVSSRNAEFLHNEVPGIKLSDEIREAMARVAHDKEKSKQEGLAIAKALIDTAFDLFNGIYLITPFMRYELTVELAHYIQQKEQEKAAKEISNG